MKNNRGLFIGGATVVGLAVIGTLIYLLLCLTTIAPGYVGVVYDRSGGLEKETLPPGWHLVSPTKKVTEYPISTETVHYEGDKAFSIATKDGKVVKAELMYSYHMDEKRIPDVFAKFRGRTDSEIESTYMKDRLSAMIQEITSNYGVLEVYGDKRGEINNKVFESFRKDLDAVGIEIETFNFSKIEPDAESLKAIQSLVDSQLKLEQLRIEKDQAQVTAEKQLVVANGNANAKIAEAQGEAKANAALQQSITPELLKKMEMEARLKWGWVTIQGAQAVVTENK
ncbi:MULTISPECIES: prohibitin family protein [unclassified Paenibacillus]|uniref:prohibitin family protein n=1 Tax=unclassified Paenibacillus TaxID=185978 RepID=UPI000896CC1F|nr:MULTISPECIES: prohibitin family protein [unclassified Paenibacillus]OMC68670.1 hypothetical protein BK126_12645 [Paenibacillus sp. FSL H7-0326]SDW55635.1 Regulator of protease activity HflC, stomatin/prohibitin superfamily [Paenibacillus sp. PDC88]